MHMPQQNITKKIITSMTLKNYERNDHLSVGDHLEDLLQCCHHLLKPPVHLRVRVRVETGDQKMLMLMLMIT